MVEFHRNAVLVNDDSQRAFIDTFERRMNERICCFLRDIRGALKLLEIVPKQPLA